MRSDDFPRVIYASCLGRQQNFTHSIISHLQISDNIVINICVVLHNHAFGLRDSMTNLFGPRHMGLKDSIIMIGVHY